VGTVAFGVFLLRTRAYPRLLCLAYIVFPTLLAVLSPLPDSPLKNAVHCLAGLTVAWLAITLWRTTPARHSRTRAAARPPVPLDNRSS
jgi:Gpi18-like mannosyltransferase